MKPEDFEKIVLALESIDQKFPNGVSETPLQILQFRQKLLRLANDGMKILQELKSQD